MELWDLYDRDGNKTGEVWERKPGNFRDIPDGRYHLVSDILVKHVDGTFLLTQRDPRKEVYPGFWEPGAGGSVVQGEGPEECAVRELFEETGLKADKWVFINKTINDKNHSIYYSYLAIVSCDKDSVVLQEGETVDYVWVDLKDFAKYTESEQAMRNHVERYRPYLDEVFAEGE